MWKYKTDKGRKSNLQISFVYGPYDDALVWRGLPYGAEHPLEFVQLQEDIVVHFDEEGKVLAVPV